MATSMAADWRWMRQREDSPWYPTLRLFRQTQWGDWTTVFQRIAREVRQTYLAMASPIVAEIAPGELLDKIAILQIKRRRVRDERKLANIHTELGGLLAAKVCSVKPSPELDRLTAHLGTVNEALWEIEDAIRLHERRDDFAESFIDLAWSVYQQNDARADVKRQVNALLGSRLSEEKSYTADGELAAV
jgi:hypothetical protein